MPLCSQDAVSRLDTKLGKATKMLLAVPIRRRRGKAECPASLQELLACLLKHLTALQEFGRGTLLQRLS